MLLACYDEIGQDGDNGPIHGHRHRYLIERDAIKEDFHILNAVDGHACFADIPLDTGVVAVIAAMGGEVEGDRDALLPRCKVLAIEGV